MKKEDFIGELKLYDSRIIEAIQCYILTERLVDWYEYKPELKKYIGFLGPTCESLKHEFYLHFTALFDGRSKIDIKKLIRKVQNEPWYDKKIDSICNKYSFITDEKAFKLPLVNSMDYWRDSFVAHYDDVVVDSIVFNNAKKNNQIDIENMLKLLINLHDDINTIFDILSKPKRKLLLRNFNDIDLFMEAFFREEENIPEYSFDLGKFL